MELRNNIIYLLSVFLFLAIQKCFSCLRCGGGMVVVDPCCGQTSLPDFTNGNLYPNNPIYNPLLLSSESDPFTTGQKSFGLAMPPPFASIEEKDPESVKAYSCSLIPCFKDDNVVAVCACNYNTGNVVSFHNSCEVEKHNCRFSTNFKIILNEICPWEFESRRNNREFEVDLTNPKYYN